MFRLSKSILVFIVVMATLVGPAQATPDPPDTPGDLDGAFAGFGQGGLVTVTEVAGSLADMALQPDGKIVAAGFSGGNLLVMRYLSNGVLDRTFSGDGIATLTYLGFAVRANAVAVQTDGKIVVAGEIFTNPSSFLLARLTMAGGLDTSFGSGGFVTTDFDSDVDVAEAVLIQPDGKIVAAGYARVGGDDDFAVARYNSNGVLDSTFGSDGKVTIGFGGDDRANDLALQDDGKLVLVGGNDGLLDQDHAVARLNPSGTLDASLDGDGKLTTGFGFPYEQASAVAIQPDGRIVVAGGQNFGDEAQWARYLPNGALDISFDGDGKRTIPSAFISDIAVQPDGKLVSVGIHAAPSGDFNFAFYRLNPNASPDTTFDGDGDAFIDLGGQDSGDTLALEPDGRILAMGSSGDHPVLMQLWPDATFDTGGQQTLGYANPLFGLGSDETAYGMALQSDGKIVVAGEVRSPTNAESDLALARFLPNGRLDTSFGDQGRVWFGFGQYDVARAVAIQPDGKIVVAGSSDPPGSLASNFLVARFNPDGTKDETFGFFGFNIVDFAGSTDDGHALALAPDGKIVVAGVVWNGARYVIGMARFTIDGLLDSSFGAQGKVITQWTMGTNWVTAVVVQPDCKIVVGGYANAFEPNADFGLMRFAENGNMDGTFGSQGVTITDMGGRDSLNALALSPDGWIYAAGARSVSLIDVDFAMAQYTPDGVLTDAPNGWSGGKAFVDLGGIEGAYAVDVRADGQVVAAGRSDGGFAWAQLPPNGSTLTPIKGSADFAGGGDRANGVKFVAPNKIVLVGQASFNDDENMVLARFETTTLLPTPPAFHVFLPLTQK